MLAVSEPLPGFGSDDFVPVDSGGGVAVHVAWRGAPLALGKLKGKMVKLKFYLKDANLYSFKIQDI